MAQATVKLTFLLSKKLKMSVKNQVPGEIPKERLTSLEMFTDKLCPFVTHTLSVIMGFPSIYKKSMPQ